MKINVLHAPFAKLKYLETIFIDATFFRGDSPLFSVQAAMLISILIWNAKGF